VLRRQQQQQAKEEAQKVIISVFVFAILFSALLDDSANRFVYVKQKELFSISSSS